VAFSVYTIAAEEHFLRVLVRAILDGFPVGRTDIPLSHWTILLPNRRSARLMEQLFLQESGARALLLPRIRPIGDIDEDLVADSLPHDGVPDGISPTNHLHAIFSLIKQWTDDNRGLAFAEEIAASGAQMFALAQSLQALVDQFETEDVDVDLLQGVYDLDLAGHRQSILDLLKIITGELPKRLAQHNCIGHAQRRNMMIRLEAERIATRKHRGPIIAAGSTGTNPATRDLLFAVARDAMGAVVLPGIDRVQDDAAWNAITPEHPQFALKTMLMQWGLPRAHVQTLGQPEGPRMWLMRAALRPADVADAWPTLLQNTKAQMADALQNVELVAAETRAREADLIALRLRQHVAESKGKAALVTPDRDLAIRVKASLRRWNLSIDDSAGEPLAHFGKAAIMLLLLRCIEDRFAAPSLFALLYHLDCRFDHEPDAQRARVEALDIAGFRGLPEADGLSHVVQRLRARRAALPRELHAHPMLRNLSDAEWDGAEQLATLLEAILTPLADGLPRSLAEHIERLLRVVEALCPRDPTPSPPEQAFYDVMAALTEGSHWHPVLPLKQAQHSLVHALAREMLRPPLREEAQLAIYGLSEARLIHADFVVLGGLAETVWPERLDTGPWLNRPMRDALKVQQPERDIGLTAHDFAQGMGHAHVMVTWPKRMGTAPAIPSRWVLRLQAVMAASGHTPSAEPTRTLNRIADQLDAPRHFAPVQRPRVTPPVALRPTRFSVTRIEKLVRDSYWIYARNILRLVPGDAIGDDIDAALRGSLVHAALHAWARGLPQVPATESLNLLMAKGREVFQPYMDMPEVARFWWPRFTRMAEAFIAVDANLRDDTLRTLTEIDGAHAFMAAGVEHGLTARADRIDIGHDGSLRLIDYKTGSTPTVKQIKSGFAPQLTLEGWLAQQKAFAGIDSTDVADVIYFYVGGVPVKLTSLAEKEDVATEIAKAAAGMLRLLETFQQPTTAYIPRHNMQSEDAMSDYDHLSRRLEWQLRGGGL
jgi:ATP-dependent helicase/nuclease subunit B